MARIYANETMLRKDCIVHIISSPQVETDHFCDIEMSLFLQRGEVVDRERSAVGEHGHLEEAESTKKDKRGHLTAKMERQKSQSHLGLSLSCRISPGSDEKYH